MKAIVCVKQVPDTSGKVSVKPDGTLDRASMATITNPDDLNAIEAALTLKDAVKAHLLELGHEVKDFGIYQAGEKCDYPEKAAEVARYLRDGNAERGILICGTGVGMSIAANKVKGIRACCCSDTFSARMTRAHNDANILTFGERVVGQGLAMELVDAFLPTEFEGGRHQRRVDLIAKLEAEE